MLLLVQYISYKIKPLWKALNMIFLSTLKNPRENPNIFDLEQNLLTINSHLKSHVYFGSSIFSHWLCLCLWWLYCLYLLGEKGKFSSISDLFNELAWRPKKQEKKTANIKCNQQGDKKWTSGKTHLENQDKKYSWHWSIFVPKRLFNLFVNTSAETFFSPTWTLTLFKMQSAHTINCSNSQLWKFFTFFLTSIPNWYHLE